ncbi:MAG: class B sortase [Lachnospiraceae bacterium]|nr:class B sortase [Lachnospiraceae bacterium]
MNDNELNEKIDEELISSFDNDSADVADIVSSDIARAIEEKTGRTEEDDEKKREYKIGGYVFNTYYEYRNAEEDIKRIEIIKKNIDISDPEAAVKLYNTIREGSIEFKSPIGEKFFDYIADVVADKSVGLLEDKKVVDEAEGAAKNQKIMAIAVLALAVFSFSYFAYSEISDIVETRRIQKVSELKNTSSSEKYKSDSVKTSKKDANGNPLVILPEYQDAYSKNSDLVGWLKIDGTDIDYPVLCKNKDNEYYLNHSFEKADDKNGSIFMDYRSDIINPTTNTIIYGHNMSSGMMFGSLKNYLDESFFQQHKTIAFDTLYEKRQYEIVAVCLSNVAYQDEDQYRYYNFIQAKTKAEWEEFYNDVNGRNVYGTTVDLKDSDQILTLSTCNKYMTDGRLFIVAKRVDKK